jgi:hypothetical protein
MATSVNTLGRAWGAGCKPPSTNPKHADGPGEREPDQCVGDHEIPQVGGFGDQVIPHPAIT